MSFSGVKDDNSVELRKQLEQLILSNAAKVKSAPLSDAQKRLNFLQKLHPENTAYHIFKILRLSGKLNVEVLKSSLNEIVRRHGSFRTKILRQGEGDLQCVSPSIGIHIPYQDFSHLPQGEAEKEAIQFAKKESEIPFILSDGNLFRFRLFKISNDVHLFSLCLHHIITDGWSMRIFYKELTTLYNSQLTGTSAELENLEFQYTDHAVRQQNLFQGEGMNKQMLYWKKKLEDCPKTHQLTLDFPRPIEQTFGGERVNFSIDTSVFENLRRVCVETYTTPYIFALAAYSVLISRYSNCDDIVIGSPNANRNYKNIESLIGLFVNTLALRIRIPVNATFRDILDQVKSTVFESVENLDFSFERIVEMLQPERNLNHNPIFQLVFAYHNFTTDNKINLSGLNIDILSIHKETIAVDLELHLNDNQKSGLNGYFLFNKAIFQKSTIERMINHYINLLKNLTSNIDKKVTEIDFLPEEEKQFILSKLNSMGIDYPKSNSVGELFEEQVRLNPNNDAVVFLNQKLTYTELNDKSNQVALTLRNLGVKPNSIVGVYMERSIDFIVGLIGIIKAGGAYLPIDLNTPSDRISSILSDSEAKCLLVNDDMTLDEIQGIERINVRKINNTSSLSGNLELVNSSSDLLYVIYTSGTTGTPKGVPIKHLGFLNLIANQQRVFNLKPTNKISQIANISFDAMCAEVWPCLASGACLYIIDEETKYNSNKIKQFIINNKITHAYLPTVYSEELVLEDWPSDTSLRCLLTAGDKLKKYPKSNLPFKFYNLYGPTEDTVWTTYKEVSAKSESEVTQYPSIGIPITNRRLYILDPQNNLLPIGISGELCISGIGLTDGYLKKPELSNKKFIDNPFERGEKIYKTGDLARLLPNSEIEIIGRIDNQVKINGFRIELEEIEQCMQGYDNINEVVAVVKENSSGNKSLHAFFTSKEEVNSNELKEYLRKKVPSYMIPSSFTRVDLIPLTSSGKVDKKYLSELTIQTPVASETFEPPKNNTEKDLSDIWKEVLNLESVGVNDNFFEIGGHSLLIAKLINMINSKVGLSLSEMDIFRYPTIRAICNKFNNEKTDDQTNKPTTNTSESKKKNLDKILQNRKK